MKTGACDPVFSECSNELAAMRSRQKVWLVPEGKRGNFQRAVTNCGGEGALFGK
jgi:hypothetical protein